MLLAVAGGLAGTLGAFAVGSEIGPGATAASDPGTGELPCVVPYHGRLEKDGVGWDGVVDLSFRLYDAGGALRWQEDWTADAGRGVTVVSGRFEVLLGTWDSAALVAAIDHADDLWLDVRARADAASGWAQLEDRRPFRHTAYALWAQVATEDLTFNGGLTVAGVTRVTNRVELGGATMDMDGAGAYLGYSASGTEQNGSYALVFGDDDQAEGAQIKYRSADDLISFEPSMFIDDDVDRLTVSSAGALGVKGPASIGGRLVLQGPFQLTGGADMALSSGSRILLDGGSAGDSIVWKTSSGTKLTWAYSASANELSLMNGTTDLFTVESDGDVTSAATLTIQTNGKALIAATLAKSNVVDLEVNDADKVYVGDSSCTQGALKGGTIDGSGALCVCFDDTPDDGDDAGHGWYCIN